MTDKEAIIALLSDKGPMTVPQIVETLYPTIPDWKRSNAVTHIDTRLRKLEKEGRVVTESKCGRCNLWKVVE